jgi:hypothetical protein
VRDRVRALLVLMGVFILGCILGAAGSHFWFKKYIQPVSGMRADGPPPPHGRTRLPELLEMTPDQEKRFGEIMQESRRKLDTLQVEQRPKIEAVLEETNRQIASILNEKQQKKYQEFLIELKKWRPRESRGGRFGPPPYPSRNMPMNPEDRPFSEPGERPAGGPPRGAPNNH